jgi:RNA polymerase sigma factor (sigma-70 family)
MTDLSQDRELLRQYVHRASEPAFAELVARYVDMVFSAAMRQVRRRDLAEEVTQVTFIILARKAPSLGPDVILPAWLHRTAHFTAANVLKTEARRRNHERKAAEMNVEFLRVDSSWEKLSPVLDEAVAKLNDKDRAAILLRFFQRKSMAETGQALGVSEDAAAMRVSRALAKLRSIFREKGVAMPATSLAGVMAANAVHAAPPTLLPNLAANVFASINTPAAIATTSAVCRSMTIAKVKAITFYTSSSIAAAAAILLVGYLASMPMRAAHPAPQDPPRQTMDTQAHDHTAKT